MSKGRRPRRDDPYSQVSLQEQREQSRRDIEATRTALGLVADTPDEPPEPPLTGLAALRRVGEQAAQAFRDIGAAMNAPVAGLRAATLQAAYEELVREVERAGGQVARGQFRRGVEAAYGTHNGGGAMDYVMEHGAPEYVMQHGWAAPRVQPTLSIHQDPAYNTTDISVRCDRGRFGIRIPFEDMDRNPYAVPRALQRISEECEIPLIDVARMAERAGLPIDAQARDWIMRYDRNHRYEEEREREIDAHFGYGGYRAEQRGQRVHYEVMDEAAYMDGRRMREMSPRPSRAEANKRARELLLKLLTPEQQKTWISEQYLDLTNPQGNTYRIYRYGSYNVHTVVGGQVMMRLCAGPDKFDRRTGAEIPMDDFIAGQVLALVYDEGAFLKVANVSPLHDDPGSIAEYDRKHAVPSGRAAGDYRRDDVPYAEFTEGGVIGRGAVMWHAAGMPVAPTVNDPGWRILGYTNA